ncbi:MAG: class I tRNA ligase family protein [Bacteroidales bacterium]|nr:class I tRNA ligase family protein [Bacteroidales bacterium]
MSKTISLNVKCPNCNKSLMDNEVQVNERPSIKLNVETAKDRGTIRLCSTYGCYDHQCDIDLPDGEIARFFCPNCNKELVSKDKCESCDAPMVTFTLQLGGKVYICSRRGCEQHFVAFEDLALELRKFYHEYGF